MPSEPGNPASGTRFDDVRWVAETGSTNADAAVLARAGAREGVVLVADHQTAGRGRLGRTWEAPPASSLLSTVLLRPPTELVDVVMLAVATAMAAAVDATTGVDVRIKWPNDLTVDDRKLAGVLAEVEWPPDGTGPAVCAGVGVNCNWPDDVPDELADRLVALNHLTGAPVDREALLAAYLRELEARYADLDRASLVAEWRSRSATLGRRVRVDVGVEVVEGVAADLDEDGFLVVEFDAGGRRTFAVGDVTHLRHASPPAAG